MARITLQPDVRVFERPGARTTLLRTETYLAAGTTVETGDPRLMFYDHQNHIAVPFDTASGQTGWLLVHEVGAPELKN